MNVVALLLMSVLSCRPTCFPQRSTVHASRTRHDKHAQPSYMLHALDMLTLSVSYTIRADNFNARMPCVGI
jgi:hypothetical protein